MAPSIAATPQSTVSSRRTRPAGAEIGSLRVSDSWKLKFRLLRKAGVPGLKNLKALAPGERVKIGFNVLAFLFGPLYYFAKGMWKKALSLFVACVIGIVALEVILGCFGLYRVANALGYGVAAIFAVRANVDYYKKMVLGDNGWW